MDTNKEKATQDQYSIDHTYSVLSGTIEPNEPSPDNMQQLDRIICEFMRGQDIPGASLCLNYHGKPLYRQGYGIARCGQRVRTDSYFRIASISKLITAIGVLRLVEDGLLRLDSQVFGSQGILCEFHCSHDNQTTITVLHLLQHSAGWDRDKDGDHVFWYSDPAHSDNIDVFDSHMLIQYVLTFPLAFQPGTNHAYSNLTYLVLGEVIERISGQPYGDYVTNLLQQYHIDVFVGKTLQEQSNQFLEVKYFNNSSQPTATSIFNREYVVAPQYGSFPMENSGSYGGLVTYADNLVKLVDGLIFEYDHVTHILTRKSVVFMMKRPSTSEDWYGLGIDVEDSGHSFGHTGAMDGTSTTLHHDKSGFTWALLFNSWAKDMDLNGLMKYALSTVRGYSLFSIKTHNFGSSGCFHGERCHGDCLLMSKDGKQCVSIHVPHSKLPIHASDMKDKGFTIGYLSAFSGGHNVLFNVIWNITSRKILSSCTLVLDVKQSELSGFVYDLNKSKQSVGLCQSYIMGGSIYHAFVIHDEEALTQRIHCTSEKDYEANIKTYNDLDHVLTCQSVFTFKHAVYVTAVYRRLKATTKYTKARKSQKQWTSLPVKDFATSLQEMFQQGYRLDHLQFYTVDGMTRVSAIWTKLDISKQAFGRYIIYHRYNVSKYGLLYELKESMAKNQPVKCLCSYRDDGVDYFMCIWGRYNRSNKTPSIRGRNGKH